MATWGSYLARGAFSDNKPVHCYHMCDKQDFEKQTANGGAYYPPTFHMDKFVHCTEVPSMLLEVGNHFYKTVVGEWICIKLDPMYFGARCRYEPAAAVGGSADMQHDASVPLLPHVYGPLYQIAVVQSFPIIRGEDGSFLSIEGLV